MPHPDPDVAVQVSGSDVVRHDVFMMFRLQLSSERQDCMGPQGTVTRSR